MSSSKIAVPASAPRNACARIAAIAITPTCSSVIAGWLVASLVWSTIAFHSPARSVLFLAGVAAFVLITTFAEAIAPLRRCIAGLRHPAAWVGATALSLIVSGSCSSWRDVALAIASVVAFVLAARLLHRRTVARMATENAIALTVLAALPLVVLIRAGINVELLSQVAAVAAPADAHVGAFAVIAVVGIAALVATELAERRGFSHFAYAATIGTAILGSLLLLRDVPDAADIDYNYPFFFGAAQQSLLAHGLHFGVSQYGSGPVLLLVALHWLLGDTRFGDWYSVVFVAVLVANAAFYAGLGVVALRAAGSRAGIVAAALCAVPGQLTVGGITESPSVAGLRFLPLVLACIAFGATHSAYAYRPGRESLPRYAALAVAVMVCTFWSGDVALMGIALALSGTLFAAWRHRIGAAVPTAIASAGGAATGLALLYLVDPANFDRWTVEFLAVLRAYANGLGALPVFVLTTHGEPPASALWVFFFPCVIGVMLVAVSLPRERSRLIALAGALALVGCTYFVGRAHSNNSLHVAPMLIAALVAATFQVRQVFAIPHSSGGAVSGASATGTRLLLPVAGVAILIAFALAWQGRTLQRYVEVLSQIHEANSASIVDAKISTVLKRWNPSHIFFAAAPAFEMETRDGLGKPNEATFGLPAQDIFGAGLMSRVRTIADSPSCIAVIVQNDTALPASEQQAVALARDAFPRVVARVATTAASGEIRSNSTAGCLRD